MVNTNTNTEKEPLLEIPTEARLVMVEEKLFDLESRINKLREILEESIKINMENRRVQEETAAFARAFVQTFVKSFIDNSFAAIRTTAQNMEKREG